MSVSNQSAWLFGKPRFEDPLLQCFLLVSTARFEAHAKVVFAPSATVHCIRGTDHLTSSAVMRSKPLFFFFQKLKDTSASNKLLLKQRLLAAIVPGQIRYCHRARSLCPPHVAQAPQEQRHKSQGPDFFGSAAETALNPKPRNSRGLTSSA